MLNHQQLRTKTAAMLIFALCSLSASVGFAKGDKAAKPIDKELEKYWNVELAVPTMTNATYAHKGALEGTIAFGVVPNDSYYLPLALSLRGAYHMTENLAIEISGSYFGLSSVSDLHAFLQDAGKEGFLKGVRKPPEMAFGAAADIMFRPFHGKLGLFDKKISSFDMAFLLGLGVISAQVDETPEKEDELTSQMFLAAHWGMTLRFFLSKWLTVRADYRQYAFKPYDDTLFPVEITIGLSFLSK